MMYKIFWILRALFYAPFFGRFGMPSYMGRPTYLSNVRRIFVGNNVRIFPHVRMEAVGKEGRIVIGNNVGIGQNVHITSGSELKIGDGTAILANVFITNIDHSYEEIGIPVLSQRNIIKTTEIGSNCFIGIGAAIQAGTILGMHCIVGANSVVRGVFDDYCVIVGAPAKVVKKYNPEKKVWEKIDN
ncbi:acyltransferase [Niabella insulamsoli]|uniref:acyltransferase n=1 Tax=Niabella insulamsoli TaxID=3144874 RepID=UPI0031FD90B3